MEPSITYLQFKCLPGGPSKRQPFGSLPPSTLNFSGFIKKSTISCSSCFASSQPLTSSNVTSMSSGIISFAPREMPNRNPVN